MKERESTYLEAIQSISRQQVVRRLRRLAEKGFFEEKGFELHKCVLDTGNNTANEHSWYDFREDVREMVSSVCAEILRCKRHQEIHASDARAKGI